MRDVASTSASRISSWSSPLRLRTTSGRRVSSIDRRRRHPVQRLVAAGVAVHEHPPVGLEHEQPHRLRQPGAQAAGVLDGAAGDDQAHGRENLPLRPAASRPRRKVTADGQYHRRHASRRGLSAAVAVAASARRDGGGSARAGGRRAADRRRHARRTARRDADDRRGHEPVDRDRAGVPAARLGTSRCQVASEGEDGVHRVTFTAPYAGRWTIVVDAGAERQTGGHRASARRPVGRCSPRATRSCRASPMASPAGCTAPGRHLPQGHPDRPRPLQGGRVRLDGPGARRRRAVAAGRRRRLPRR